MVLQTPSMRSLAISIKVKQPVRSFVKASPPLVRAGVIIGPFLVVLMAVFYNALRHSTSVEIAGAFGSFIGDIVGAGGAVWAVFLTLSQQGREDRRKQQDRELQQINAVIAGVAFNLEVLLHLAHDYLLPRHEQSHVVYKAYSEGVERIECAKRLIESIKDYPVLNTKWPEISFFECNFWQELPFIVEKDPEILKQSGWLNSLAMELKNHIGRRNRIIDDTMTLMQQDGGLRFPVFGSIVQQHASIANAECVTGLQLFEKLLDMTKSLRNLHQRTKKVTPPPPLQGVMAKLSQIAVVLRAREPRPPNFP